MTRLVKDPTTIFIPGNPLLPPTPYVPAQPERTVTEYVESCSYGYSPGITVLSTRQTLTYVGGYTCIGQRVVVTYPATAAIPASPATPPRAAQIIVSMNRGWNSYAKTVDSLDRGSYIEFSVKPGSYAALIAIGLEGMEGASISAFRHGIMVDSSGAYVFEDGAAVAQLSPANVASTILRIARLADGRIVYSAAGISSYVSTLSAYDQFADIYAYGMLYSAYDEVSNAEFIAGEIISEFSPVVLRGYSSLAVMALPRAIMPGESELLVAIGTMAVQLPGHGALSAEFVSNPVSMLATLNAYGAVSATLDRHGSGSVAVSAFVSVGGDYDYPGTSYVYLPEFTSYGEQAVYTPPVPTTGYANMPFMVASGYGTEEDIGGGGAEMESFVSLAADYDYGAGSASMLSFIALATGGFVPENELYVFSNVLAQSSHAAAIDLVLILNSAGAVQSSLSLTRAQALGILSSMQGSDSLSISGIYAYAIVSSARGLSLQLLNVNDLADVDDTGVVWVVNIETNASSQYEGYGFRSFFTRAGVAYGVAADGVYRLEGATDAGAQIDALANLGKMDMATTLQKLLPNVYLGASSTGKLKLEVDADGSVYVYEARSSEDGTFKQHRVDLGRGLKANMLGLTVKNKNGADFKLATVDLLQAPGGRRI